MKSIGDRRIVSAVETEYASSPMGKVKRVSMPHAPGATAIWTTYNYDVMGRTTSVTAPDSSATTYAYAGNTLTVTDPAGKWKKHTNDAFGNLAMPSITGQIIIQLSKAAVSAEALA